MNASENSRQEIAARIRELRDSVGESAAAVAARLGIGLELLEAYETGEKDVPISTLYEIAGFLGVDLTDLLTGKSPNLQQYCVVRDGKGPEVERYPGYRFQSLAFGFANRRFEPLLVTLDPEKNQQVGLVVHSGQEFNLVLAGRIRVIMAGHTVDLGCGDSVYFDPTLPHAQLALDNQPARFLTVILHEPAASENCR